MFHIRDASRILQFEGTLLASASSERSDSLRWVEFELYRTTAKTYVLSRIGRTLLYHAPSCAVVSRNGLGQVPLDTLTPGHVPCGECRPETQDALADVCPESARYRAVVSETPEGILEVLYRFDDYGVRYLTVVARRLIEQAAIEDADIANVYRTETIA
jgi:hypothetical protein